MKFLIFVVVLFFMGCSGPDEAPGFVENEKPGADVGHDVGGDGRGDAGGLEGDGDDSADEPGECADNPCDELIEHPECRIAECDDLLGCSFQNIREALSCDAPGIRDGRCQAGRCTGTICTCDAETECCDGCLPVNDGAACDDGDASTGADTCQAGQCVGEPCECSEGACCDGCFLLERDTVCDDEPIGHKTFCAGEANRPAIHRRNEYSACDGISSECGVHSVWIVDPGYEWQCSWGDSCGIKPGDNVVSCIY